MKINLYVSFRIHVRAVDVFLVTVLRSQSWWWVWNSYRGALFVMGYPQSQK